MSAANPTLHVLSGLPGAGKSTRARLLTESTGAVLVGRDELRAAMPNLPDDWLLTLLMVDAARSLLANGYDVVIDAWNLHPRDRERWEECCAQTGAKLEWTHMTTPIEECIRRDALRPAPNGERRVRWAAAEYGLNGAA